VLLPPVPVAEEVGLGTAAQFFMHKKNFPKLEFPLICVAYEKCMYVIYREKCSRFSARVPS